MPTFISIDGVAYPARERVGLVNNSGKAMKHPNTGEMIEPGDPYIYDGPDRAAMLELYNADNTGKTTTFGQDFRKNHEFLQIIRSLNFKDDKEYLAFIGYNDKESEEKKKNLTAVVNKHELPAKVEAIKILGGGKDYAAGSKNNRYGGFGDYGDDLQK